MKKDIDGKETIAHIVCPPPPLLFSEPIIDPL
jgi:hypothetical protein